MITLRMIRVLVYFMVLIISTSCAKMQFAKNQDTNQGLECTGKACAMDCGRLIGVEVLRV